MTCPGVQGVANRDLKLENLLLHRDMHRVATAVDARSNRRPLLKICDFGYSKHELNSPATSGVGTPIYMAPEIIYGISRYDAKVNCAEAPRHPPSRRWCTAAITLHHGHGCLQHATRLARSGCW